jgi:hypothetical protein
MVLYAYMCYVCIFSLHRESPNMILRDKPSFLSCFYHSWLSVQDYDKTHTKTSKNHNNIVGEERLAHINTIVVSLGGKLTYVLFYVTTELHQRRYIVIF